MMPFNMNPQQILSQMLQSNPNVGNNQQAQNIIQVLMSGDAKRGQELANNICKSMQMSPQDAQKQAQEYFSRKFINN